jgi:hypothetical protein
LKDSQEEMKAKLGTYQEDMTARVEPKIEVSQERMLSSIDVLGEKG